VDTYYPWDGLVKIKVLKAPKTAVLALRIPNWCEKYSLKGAKYAEKDGYALFTNLSDGDILEFAMEMPVVMLEANPRVRENIGKVAVRRGPVVYCLEEVDNGKDLHLVHLEADTKFEAAFDKDFFGGAVTIKSNCKRLENRLGDTLYSKVQPAVCKDASVKWVPYYLWANRGAGEMICWVHSC